MRRYISVPCFEVSLVTQSLVCYCLTRWSPWCKWRKFSSSDSGRVSASSDLATVTTSRNSTVTSSLTSRIALQTEEPCIELEWVVVVPSVVWQLCVFGGSEGWRVRSQKLCRKAQVWSGQFVGFLSQKLMTEMSFDFLLQTENWVDLNHLFQTNAVRVIPRLTSDLLTNFSANVDFFAVFWTRLTNMDSANECFSGCAR